MLLTLYMVLGLALFAALAALALACDKIWGGYHALSFSNRPGAVHGVPRLRHHRSRAIL